MTANLPAILPRIRGVVDLESARLFAGGIDEYRLNQLIEDGTLVRRGHGLDEPHFFAALKQQEELRASQREIDRDWARKSKQGRQVFPVDDGIAMLALGVGNVTVWATKQWEGRLPGIDYDTALRQAIVEGANYSDAVDAIEAAIWLRVGDPAAIRLDSLKNLAGTIATSWTRVVYRHRPADWTDRQPWESKTLGVFPTPREAIEAALPWKHWSVVLGRETLIDSSQSDRIRDVLRFWADRVPGFNPRADGVSNGLCGSTIDLFDKAMAELRRAAGQFYDFFVDHCGRATC